MEVGVKTTGKLQQIPSKLLTGGSMLHANYEIRMTPKTPIPDSKLAEVASTLKTEIPKNVEGVIVKYVQVSPSSIIMDVTGSPFLWVELLAFLPQIMTALGVVIGLITVYFVVTSIPTWAYALGAIGILAIFVLPKYLPKFKL